MTMRFLPQERLEFACSLDDVGASIGLSLIGANEWDGKITLVDRNVATEFLCIAAGGEKNQVLLTPKLTPLIVTPPTKDISRVSFHLFNLPNFYGSGDYILETEERSQRCGRVVLTADGWEITIAATDAIETLTKELESLGGYAITHVGSVVRTERSNFSNGDLEDLLRCLHYFISFSFGRWVGLSLPVGFDVVAHKVFKSWGMGQAADGPWNGSTAFLDRHHSEMLTQTFPGFRRLWRDVLWRRSTRTSIYWYLGANDRGTGIGVDAGLILAQTALELLAWTYCVLDRKLAPPSKFRRGGWSASKKLRLLMSELKIPVAIPSTLTALHSAGPKWDDGLAAVTAVRNSLVHPDNASVIPRGAYFEAWQLSLWYIDMVLLRLCDHRGKYANRLTPRRWTGQIESVPWAS